MTITIIITTMGITINTQSPTLQVRLPLPLHIFWYPTLTRSLFFPLQSLLGNVNLLTTWSLSIKPSSRYTTSSVLKA
jgi:hypothetical protein